MIQVRVKRSPLRIRPTVHFDLAQHFIPSRTSVRACFFEAPMRDLLLQV
jgi:hypothetical protein